LAVNSGERRGKEAGGTNMSDTGIPDFTNPEDVRRYLFAKYYEFAAMPPEQTKGTLNAQIKACEALYVKFGYQPALQMLDKIVSIDVSRTKGRPRGQEAAAKLLKRFLNAVKVDKSGIQ
jgi:hypothetical protein